MIGQRWGVSDDDVARRYPCDDVVPEPTLRAWRGVSVPAPPDVVWRRVVQLRLAPYSYDLLDNAGRRSPRQLCDLPDPVPGDAYSATAGHPIGRVVSVERGRHLTAEIAGAVMSYVVVPAGTGTRLLLKIVARPPRWVAPALSLGDLVMARRQLLNLRDLATADHRSGAAATPRPTVPSNEHDRRARG